MADHKRRYSSKPLRGIWRDEKRLGISRYSRAHSFVVGSIVGLVLVWIFRIANETSPMTFDPTNVRQIEDKEANLFAMALLMPEDWVRAEVRKIKHFDLTNDKMMKRIADKFQVPVSIMAMRIGQLYQ